ncbi:hypothetical protein M5X00_10940 [Paenibacillus alvei]|uniref:hypothetical protein n=1 Tax=Paenibacillus alvei TaxID=44250 RepID=UPI002282BC9C|nr:hypothetical protein [Paenibacillus alvei]MCY9754764.1 hypothetical protein [Paenibacillus alvei]
MNMLPKITNRWAKSTRIETEWFGGKNGLEKANLYGLSEKDTLYIGIKQTVSAP